MMIIDGLVVFCLVCEDDWVVVFFVMIDLLVVWWLNMLCLFGDVDFDLFVCVVEVGCKLGECFDYVVCGVDDLIWFGVVIVLWWYWDNYEIVYLVGVLGCM